MNVEQIIKNHKIEQIHFCPTVNKKRKEKIMKIKNIKKYDNNKKSAIFYGCKNLETRNLIKNHKGERVILWREKDVLNNTKEAVVNKIFLQNNVNNDKIKNFIFDKKNILKKLEVIKPKEITQRAIIPRKKNLEPIRLLYYIPIIDNKNILEIINDFKKLNGKRPEISLIIIFKKIIGDNTFVKHINNLTKSKIKGILFKNINNINDVLKEALNCDLGISVDKNNDQLKIYKSAKLIVISKLLSNPIFCMVDEFTYQTYKNDLNLYYLHYTSDLSKYKKLIQFYKPKVLFAESFWKGVDWSWHQKMGRYQYMRYISRTARLYGAKTIFWNKEDPVHFGKWSRYAELFDHVYTTDYNMIEKYKKLRCKNVDVLPFAANTNIFNIIKNDNKQHDKIVFAGAWYSRFKHRSILLKNILRKLGQNFVIYDRNYYRNDPDYYYPSQFNPSIKPSVSLSELSNIYKSNRLILNLNSVTDSPTMFARRIFEILCSGAFPISNFNLGLDLIFGGYLNFIDTNSSDFTVGYLNYKKYLCCIKHSFEHFTTKSTIKYIIDTEREEDRNKSVAILYFLTKEQINNFNISLLDNFIVQDYPFKKCYLIDEEQTVYLFNEKTSTLEKYENKNILEDFFMIFNTENKYLSKFLDNILFFQKNYPKYLITKNGFNITDLNNNRRWFTLINNFNIHASLFNIVGNIFNYNYQNLVNKLKKVNQDRKILNTDPFNFCEKGMIDNQDFFDTKIVEDNFTGISSLKLRKILSRREKPEHDIFINTKHVIITNKYPSRKNFYKNNFVHARLKSYENFFSGIVINVQNNEKYTEYIYEGIRVININKADFYRIVLVNTEQISIHNLNIDIWKLLKSYPEINKFKINIFFHGSDLLNSKSRMKENIDIWNTIYKISSSLNITCIFDSKYLYKKITKEYGIVFPNHKIVYNAINTNLFNYVKKDSKQRKNILIIRPFNTVNNANDLIIKTILLLSKKKFFRNLSITIYGDGQLFDPMTSKVKQFKNIKLRKKILNHTDIAKIHKNYGIFLYPVKTETQGIAICEAMLSGLVPITNKKSSITEFVSKESGFLCSPDNPEEMVKAIEKLYNDEEKFLKMSKNASKKNRLLFNAREQYLEIIDDSFHKEKEVKYLQKINEIEKELIYFENIINTRINILVELYKTENNIGEFTSKLIDLTQILDYQDDDEEQNIETDLEDTKHENTEDNKNEENIDLEDTKNENTEDNKNEENIDLEEDKNEMNDDIEGTKNETNTQDLRTYFTEEEIKEIEESENEEDLNDDINNDIHEIENENEVNKYSIFENKVKIYKDKINLYKNLIKEYEEFKMGKSKLDAKDTSYLEEKTNNILNIIESINNLRNLINNF